MTTTRWFAVILLAVPIMVQVCFNSSLTYLLMRWFRVPHNIAAPRGDRVPAVDPAPPRGPAQLRRKLFSIQTVFWCSVIRPIIRSWLSGSFTSPARSRATMASATSFWLALISART